MKPTARRKPAPRVSKKAHRKPTAVKRSAAARKPKPRGKQKPARPAARSAAKPGRRSAAAKPAARRAAARPARRTVAAVKAASPARRVAAAPAVELYEAGIRAMYAQRWAEAAKLLRRVVDDADAEPDLHERALQQLHVSEDKLRGEGREDGDPFLLAVVRKNEGAYDEALALCARGGRQAKDERFAYLAASIHALRGESEEASRFLQHAIELNPKNRVHAYHDPDFQALRESGALERLFRV